MKGCSPKDGFPRRSEYLGEGFTEQNKFLNSTLKMVRGKITDFYMNRIEYLYTPEGKTINNNQNNHILSHWETEG